MLKTKRTFDIEPVIEKLQDSTHRQDPRSQTCQPVKLHHDITCFGTLCDVSSAGAKVRLNGKSRLKIGASAELELLDGTTFPVVVVRRDGDEVGLKFDLRFLDVSELLHFDHLGQDLFLSIVRHQKFRARVTD